MNSAINPLTELRDYHLPPPISWWPLALGWWLLLLLILAVIGMSIGIWWYRRKKFASFRYAKIELIKLKSNLDKNGDVVNFIRGISKLLRRFALTRFPRHQIAKLTGIAWLKFLDDHGGQGKFQDEFKWLLTEFIYQNETVLNLQLKEMQHVEKLVNIVANWLQHNRELLRR